MIPGKISRKRPPANRAAREEPMTRSAVSLLHDRKKKKTVKMVRFHSGEGGFRKAEETLSRLVDDGWKIVTAGGGVEMGAGFVILQRVEEKES